MGKLTPVCIAAFVYSALALTPSSSRFPIRSSAISIPATKTPGIVSSGRDVDEVLQQSRFRSGNYWIWLYRDNFGNPSSWERYAVVDSVPERPQNELTIEMASKFSDADSYRPHHRFGIVLQDALLAVSPTDWTLCRFEFHDSDGEWRTAEHRDNVIAFEEKFCCELMVNPGQYQDKDQEEQEDDDNDKINAYTSIYTTRTLAVRDDGLINFVRTDDNVGEQQQRQLKLVPLVRPARLAYTQAYYVSSGPHVGVSAFKEFAQINDEGQGSGSYTFELIEAGPSGRSVENE
jgi:hypothetical protein